MAKRAKIIRAIREAVRKMEYEFAIPHFFDEMENDGLLFSDIESAIFNGRINEVYTDDPRGPRYEIVGTAADGRTIGVICRIKETHWLLFITTWEIYE